MLGTKIDRYILTEVAGPFLGGLFFFMFLFLMSQVLRLAEMFIVHGVPIWTLLKMVFLLSISFLPTALPIAFLIAVLVAFGRLSADSELVAMKASGISLLRLAVPVAVVSLGIFVLSIALNMEWVPWSGKLFKSTLVKMSNTKAVTSIREGAFTTGFFDLLIFADKVDSRTNQLSKVFIYDARNAQNPLTIIAEGGEVIPVKTSSELGAEAVLRLYNGAIHQNDKAEGNYQIGNFGRHDIRLSIDEGAETIVTKPEMIPYRELRERMNRFSRDSFESREMRAELSKRFALALSPMIFVFLGIGFGTVRTRAVRAGAFLIAFVTAITYWVIQTAAVIGIKDGWMPPVFAMQLPNIIVSIAAFLAFRRAMW